MTAVCENILAGKFANMKSSCTFERPRCRRFTKSQTTIQATADKAGLFSGRFHFGDLDILADFQKGLASFGIYIPQIFVSKMPRCDKNLKKDAPGASASTRDSAKVSQSDLLRELNVKIVRDLTAKKKQHTVSKRELFKLQSRLLIESDAKNEAYLFILTNGYYDQFVEFVKRTRRG